MFALVTQTSFLSPTDVVNLLTHTHTHYVSSYEWAEALLAQPMTDYHIDERLGSKHSRHNEGDK